MFFNFIPNAIRDVDRRYAYGMPDQIQEGRLRVERLLKKYLPNKVIVLTRKGWSEFPQTCEEAESRVSPSLDGTRFPSCTQGTYRFGPDVVRAFGLRHPLYAVVSQFEARLWSMEDVARLAEPQAPAKRGTHKPRAPKAA